MLASCAQMKAKTGIAVARVDFSDPRGGGKGSCDRKAATIKARFVTVILRNSQNLLFKYSYILTTAKGKGGIIGFANTEILIQLLGIFFHRRPSK